MPWQVVLNLIANDSDSILNSRREFLIIPMPVFFPKHLNHNSLSVSQLEVILPPRGHIWQYLKIFLLS